MSRGNLRHSEWPLNKKVYVGGLSPHTSRFQIEDAFRYYGRIQNCWVARQPPGFAFLLFEDDRDAEDAVKDMNGRSLDGRRVRVEMSNGRRLNRRNERGYSRSPVRGGFRRTRSRSRSRSKRKSRSKSPRRTSRSRSGSRSRRRSNSRSRQKRTRSRSRSRRRTRSRSRSNKDRRSHSKSRSRTKSKSRSPREGAEVKTENGKAPSPAPAENGFADNPEMNSEV